MIRYISYTLPLPETLAGGAFFYFIGQIIEHVNSMLYLILLGTASFFNK